MYRILLDERFYLNTIEQFKYFDKLLNIIKDYFDAKIVLFEPFSSTTKSYNIYFRGNQINLKILRTHKIEKMDLNKVNEQDDETLSNLGFNKIFIGKIQYILQKYPDDILIIPYIYKPEHRELRTKYINRRIYFIGNIDEEVESNISNWISCNQLLSFDVPSIDNKFPANSICDGFDLWRSEILKSYISGEKESLFTKIGMEVAKRNHYIYDGKLTAINKRKQKKIKMETFPKTQRV